MFKVHQILFNKKGTQYRPFLLRKHHQRFKNINMKKLTNYIFTLCFIAISISQCIAQVQPPKFLNAELCFTIEANIGETILMGDSVDGKRLSIPITGGRFYGDKLKGKLLPGGADYQVIRNDGVTSLHAVYMMQTDDGILINVINDGLLVPQAENQAFYFRTSPHFIAPKGDYDWLNKAIFVAGVRGDAHKKNTVYIDVYKVN